MHKVVLFEQELTTNLLKCRILRKPFQKFENGKLKIFLVAWRFNSQYFLNILHGMKFGFDVEFNEMRFITIGECFAVCLPSLLASSILFNGESN